MRRQNIRHAQKRRVPASVGVPISILVVLIGALCVELAIFFGGA